MCYSVVLQEKETLDSVIKHGNELTSDQVSDMALSCTLNMTLTFILHEVACLRDKYVTSSLTIAACDL